MANSWLFRPFPLRERGHTSQLDPSDKSIGRAQPPHPNPLPQREREPEVASTKRVIASSTGSGQKLVGGHGGRRHPHDQGKAQVFSPGRGKGVGKPVLMCPFAITPILVMAKGHIKTGFPTPFPRPGLKT